MARKQKRWQNYWCRKMVRGKQYFIKSVAFAIILFIVCLYCVELLVAEPEERATVLYLTTGTASGAVGYYYYSDEYGGFANEVVQSFAVDVDGRIYLADTFNDRVQVFARDGRFLFQFSVSDKLCGGSGYNIAAGWDGCIYVSEIMSKKGYTGKYAAKNGKLINVFGGGGNRQGEYYHADQICADMKGDVYIYDMNLSKIEKFDKNGKYLGTLSDKGFFSISPDGNLYISGKYGIKIYDTKKSFDRPERVMINSSLLKDVIVLKVDKEGNYYCYDGEKVVRKVSSDGAKIIDEVEIIPYTGAMRKNIDIGNDGNLYVASSDYDNTGRIFFKIDRYTFKQ